MFVHQTNVKTMEFVNLKTTKQKVIHVFAVQAFPGLFVNIQLIFVKMFLASLVSDISKFRKLLCFLILIIIRLLRKWIMRMQS